MTMRRPVEWLVKQLCSQWGDTASFVVDKGEHPHEAHYLKLDCSKAKAELGWQPRWSLDKAIESIVAWTKDYEKSRTGKESLSSADRRVLRSYGKGMR